jgi:hypothetical protein
VAGSSEHLSEVSGSTKGGEFLDELSDCQLLKDCAPWSSEPQARTNSLRDDLCSPLNE